MNSNPFSKRIITIVVVAVLIFVALIVYGLFGTQSGQRAIKDIESDWGGGIERVVTVYDINGNVLKTYQGKFDIEYDSDRIKFDDEEGKRHIIFYSTGTVIVDEV